MLVAYRQPTPQEFNCKNGNEADGPTMPKVMPVPEIYTSVPNLQVAGLWLRPNAESDPYLTVFGSTNLNSRSANLDTELSFVLATSSAGLRRQLREEVDHLWEHARPWQGGGRPVRIGTKALVAVVGGML